MNDFKQQISEYSNKNIEQRKKWYSSVAEAYNQARPRYPQAIIHRTIELAKIAPEARMLEVGCGPGIATVAFAELGFSMVCLEPSQEACQLARQNCHQYANIQIHNTTFEEWELETQKFDAVLAATSFHWIPANIGYPKAASALKDNGCLILLWNMLLEPRYEVYQELQQVYQKYAPSLAMYEGREKQKEHLRGFAEIVSDSGKFQDLVSEDVECKVIYNTDDYLTLLSTYSQCISLDSQMREDLFAGLREKIEEKFAGRLELTYLSACQIAWKN
jgi:ubiquinone/menaquinone biosynthesis C-methylase UbiE